MDEEGDSRDAQRERVRTNGGKNGREKATIGETGQDNQQN